MRTVFLLLLLANLAFFAYMQYLRQPAIAEGQLALLQIAPERMKLVQGEPAPARENAVTEEHSARIEACLQWGFFGTDRRARAEALLAPLALGDRLVLRESAQSFRVQIAPLKTRQDADKKAAQLQALGAGDFYILGGEGPQRWVISLGLFVNETDAQDHLARLQQKGVRSAAIVSHGTAAAFVIRDPGDAAAARIAEIARNFPAAQLKAMPCAAADGKG